VNRRRLLLGSIALAIASATQRIYQPDSITYEEDRPKRGAIREVMHSSYSIGGSGMVTYEYYRYDGNEWHILDPV
jgi:hypothetical protein